RPCISAASRRTRPRSWLHQDRLLVMQERQHGSPGLPAMGKLVLLVGCQLGGRDVAVEQVKDGVVSEAIFAPLDLTDAAGPGQDRRVKYLTTLIAEDHHTHESGQAPVVGNGSQCIEQLGAPIRVRALAVAG